MIPVLLALMFIFILLVTVILGQPNGFRVVRSQEMSASPEVVFAHVNDLHKWEAWSPWAKLDPNSKSAFSGPDSGNGAAMRWEGNSKVGVGTMTITENKPPSQITLRLDFEKPMQATNIAVFGFAPAGNQTIVTWTMSGQNKLMGKVFSTLVNCDKMVGGQFEKGLQNLKAVVESK
jgi:hypothetical protein